MLRFLSHNSGHFLKPSGFMPRSGPGIPSLTLHRRNFWVNPVATPNPESKKFFPENLPVLGQGLSSVDFTNAMSARGSPLAKALFQQEGVKGVFLGPDFVTVTKDKKTEWDELEPIVFGTMMEFYASGEPILLETAELPKDTTILETDSESVAMIKELIETRVRPGLQADGGDIIYHGFVEGVVFVELKGSCDGCPSSAGTLKNGVERMMRHWVPECKGVLQVESKEEYEKLIRG